MVNRNKMRNLIVLFVIGFFYSCTPVKRSLSEEPLKELNESVFRIRTYCPIEGDCKVNRIKNVALQVNEVEGGNRGEMFYELVPSENSDVVIYTYNRAVDDILMDGFYREEIIFEVPKEKQRLLLEHRNLQDVKMLFGRFCYCKGETGYYKVKRGTANIKYSDSGIKAFLDIQVLDVPQLIKEVNFTVY